MREGVGGEGKGGPRSTRAEGRRRERTAEELDGVGMRDEGSARARTRDGRAERTRGWRHAGGKAG